MAMSLRPSYQSHCPHCSGAADVFAPMISARPGGFTLRCLLDECNRMRAFLFLDGRVNSEVRSRQIWYYRDFKLQGGYLEAAVDLVRDAVELHLIGQMNTDTGAKDAAYRGAAIHLRVAAQALVAGYVLQMDEQGIRDSTLGRLIGEVNDGHGARRIKSGQRSSFTSSLDYILRLGDTAAHPFLRSAERELPPTRGNIEIGLEKFEEVADAVRIP